MNDRVCETIKMRIFKNGKITLVQVLLYLVTGSYNSNDIIKVNRKNVIFQLRTSYNAVKTINGTNVNTELINATIPTTFIIHGWISDKNKPWINTMAHFLLKKHSCTTVIVVDWSVYSKNINYPAVTAQIKDVGDVVGEFILNISKGNMDNLKNIHIIGHSLGAHVAGFAGKKVYNETRKKIARITGLDAARPLYELKDEQERLSRNDARHVDAIHTNGGVFGMLKSYGTADYFPNGGGPMQPGCSNDVCSHLRAPYLYIESIYSNNFVAVECPSYLVYTLGVCNSNKKVVMGNEESEMNSGNYYLYTNSEPPFANGVRLP